jgi:hypothetical protein
MTRYTVLFIGLLVAAGTANAQQQTVGAPPETSNMRRVGWPTCRRHALPDSRLPAGLMIMSRLEAGCPED